jgi:MFS family permease
LASALALTNLVSAYFLLPEPAAFSSKRTVLSFQALLRTIRKRKMVLLLASYFLFFVAFVFLQSALPPWLQAVFGFGSLQTGLIFFFIGIVSVLTQAVLLPLLSKKFERLNLAVLGISFFIFSMGILSIVSSLYVLLIISAIASFGFGIQFVTYNTLISVNTSETAQGGTLGIAWAIAGAAQSIAPVLAASTFSYGVSVSFSGLVFVVSALIAFSILPLILAYKETV